MNILLAGVVAPAWQRNSVRRALLAVLWRPEEQHAAREAVGQRRPTAWPWPADEAPTPFWQAGVMIRRTELNRIGRSDDLPVELFLYMRLRAQGRTGHIDTVLTVGHAGDFFALIEDSLKEAMAIRNINPPIRPSPDKFANDRRAFDARLNPKSSVSDALDRMIREGTFDR